MDPLRALSVFKLGLQVVVSVFLFFFLQSKFYGKTLDLGFSRASRHNIRLRDQPRIGLDEPLFPVGLRCTM